MPWTHLELANHLAAAFQTFPQVKAITISGSLASGAADSGSDIDLYIYTTTPIPAEERMALIRKLGPASGTYNEPFWGADGDEWASAIHRSDAAHLETQPLLATAESPFDYAANAEVLIVTDVKKGDLAALAGAYARIIEACGGGVLGLFTAIRRLRAVHGRIADRLARLGLPLYAQHVDPIDTGTLVDIFRDDPRSSLLGTDALRDGVDVPGASLRCVVSSL